jgi:hypothetical protein
LSHSIHLWMKAGRHVSTSRRSGLMNGFKP